MATKTKQSIDGTSFHGTEIQATPNELKELFPESWEGQNDGRDRTNFNFVLETKDWEVFSIYDWKEYRSLEMTETIDWHIGGHNRKITKKAAIEVNALLKKLRAKKPTNIIKINISGSGTKEQLNEAVSDIMDSILNLDIESTKEKCTIKNSILTAEIYLSKS